MSYLIFLLVIVKLSLTIVWFRVMQGEQYQQHRVMKMSYEMSAGQNTEQVDLATLHDKTRHLDDKIKYLQNKMA